MAKLLWPVARNFLLIGFAFLVAVIVTLRTGDGDMFFIVFVGLSLIHILVWKLFWKKDEDHERREYFGIDDSVG